MYTKNMNLHRTTGQPDWHSVSKKKRNRFQKVAAATNGLVTPGNLITLIGFGLVLYGLNAILMQNYWLGLVLLTIGRLLDIADGWVADKTGTKSAIGEFMDAVIDKIGTLLTIIVFFAVAVADIWLLTILVLPQVIIPLVILYKRSRNVQTHPTRIGKISMAVAWASLFGVLMVRALEAFWPSPFAIAVYGLMIVSALLGSYALFEYTRMKTRQTK